MQMWRSQVGMNCPLVDGLQPQVENLGDTVIDPDDGVVVNGHAFSLFTGFELDQCDISSGTVVDSNMPRVTPPRIRSRKGEWPYPPITSRPILLSAAIDRIAP